MKHKFKYDWKLSDGYPAEGIEYHGSKVFSCFACGGGSTMGYKLSGFDVIGMNEIDKRMADAYIENHNPKYSFIEPIQDFKNRENLPKELFDLDILDGSPPCSSFSMQGNREDDWGKEKKFREGQSNQVLDTLFFDFLDLAESLQPKVVIAENVKGILFGKAKKYARNILLRFDTAGYYTSVFVLDASEMGVPQRRERVFFVGIRKDLSGKLPAENRKLFSDFPFLDLNFSEKEIPFEDIDQGITDNYIYDLTPGHSKYYDKVPIGSKFSDLTGYGFTVYKIDPSKPLMTILCEDKGRGGAIHHKQNRSLTIKELLNASSFPTDYIVKSETEAYRLCGMSVPPLMVAQISYRIFQQWLLNL